MSHLRLVHSWHWKLRTRDTRSEIGVEMEAQEPQHCPGVPGVSNSKRLPTIGYFIARKRKKVDAAVEGKRVVQALSGREIQQSKAGEWHRFGKSWCKIESVAAWHYTTRVPSLRRFLRVNAVCEVTHIGTRT